MNAHMTHRQDAPSPSFGAACAVSGSGLEVLGGFCVIAGKCVVAHAFSIHVGYDVLPCRCLFNKHVKLGVYPASSQALFLYFN